MVKRVELHRHQVSQIAQAHADLQHATSQFEALVRFALAGEAPGTRLHTIDTDTSALLVELPDGAVLPS